MRYWIFWNDLVQGPFEIEELLTLKAFRADLLVCEEGREEWTPAAAIPELAQHFVTVISTPVGTAPPPPPPQPPSLTPLQGEFFNESLAQQPLFDLNGSKNYAYRPVEDAPAAFPDEVPPQVTAPFRFAVILPPWVVPPTELPPIPEVQKPVEAFKPVSYPIVEEQPARKEILPAWTEEPIPEIAEDRVESPVEAPPIEVPPVITPLPEAKPITLPLPVEMPPPRAQEPPALSPPVVKRSTLSLAAIESRRTPPVKTSPSHAPVLDEVSLSEPKARLWPWILGVIATLGVVMGAVYLWMMHTSPRPYAVAPQPAPPLIAVPRVSPPSVPVQPTTPPMVVPVKPRPTQNKVIKPVAKKHTNKPILAKKTVAPIETSQLQPISKELPEASVDWRGKEQQAIAMALQLPIYSGQRTVGTNAALMLEDMHEKELLHAADTGERLYMPDKSSWSALDEEGPRYRVYLNFMAWQATGERTMVRSEQFEVNLQYKSVSPADESTRQDFFETRNILQHHHSAKADDIESVLSAVDVVNRQKMRAVILQTAKDKNEKKNIQNSLQIADGKLQRMIVYFRTKYAESTLQNIAHAYAFTSTIKGK